MHDHKTSHHNAPPIVAAAVIFAGCAFTTLPAAAQPAPAPPVAMPTYASGEENIRGRVTSFDGKYELQLRDERGFVDNVRLHDGTVINPTGLRLAPGQSVTILGHTAGNRFEANEIDTPYASYGVPAPAYGYPGYVYPAYAYPLYGYRDGYFGYHAYPAFGLGFRTRGFGFRGWF